MPAPAGKFMVSLKFVLPLIPSQPVAPFCTEQVQVQLVIWAGMGSVTTAPFTAAGPLFETVIVYVSVPFAA